MGSEIIRKAFHLGGLVYVLGIIVMPRETFILVVGGFAALELCWEGLRIKNPGIRRWVKGYFGPLLREEELTRISGVFWMALGVLSTALLIPSSRLAAAILMYLIFGDGVASLAGKTLQGPRWIGSKKRLSGSAACFFVCLGVGFVFLWPHYGWAGIVVGAMSATIVEIGFIPLNDNFGIPFATSLVMLMVTSQKPFFLLLFR